MRSVVVVEPHHADLKLLVSTMEVEGLTTVVGVVNALEYTTVTGGVVVVTVT